MYYYAIWSLKVERTCESKTDYDVAKSTDTENLVNSYFANTHKRINRNHCKVVVGKYKSN